MEPIELLKKHCIFTNDFDVYVLFGIARKKDNENITNSQEVVFREVIKKEDNIEKKYNKLITQCKSHKPKLNFYVYISANGRDVRKGYMTFKADLLTYEKEMMFGTDCHNQLKRIDAIWLSAIMKPQSRSLENKRFMLDVDTKNLAQLKRLNSCLAEVVDNVDDVLIQETVNGHHYVAPPFNKLFFKELLIKNKLNEMCEIKHDALFFVEHIGADKNG